ncbi:MAG TPA: DEAD/DEAH box helicase [Vicinamibacterales bacterium]|nr:DEAD/DEAH box helicase [Vicinamibacterales bacterium]
MKTGFDSLGLADTLVGALTALGYEEPTPVQREAIPLLIQGRDLLAQAATGTGKTAAFALPTLQRLGRDTGGGRATRALILVPTRELAMQVAEAFHKYAKGTGLAVVPIYGGSSMEQQIRALQRGAHIVVATPGRVLDHVRRKTIALDALRIVVLDEADEMLDMGFADDLETILQATPASRQTALFSATMPARIASIAARHLKTPARVTIAHEKVAAGKMPRVRQQMYTVSRAQKAAALARLLEVEDPTSAIVFCRTRLEVEQVTETLNSHGYRAEALHGGIVQRQRDRVMNALRSGAVDLVVATDVAARGLDVEHLTHVFNYDVPASPEMYVHRIGRTGRIGRSGVAITLAEPREQRLLRNIESFTKQKIDVATLPTVADMRARRLELTRAALNERLLARDFDDVRVVVETLAQTFDIADIAAAAVKIAHQASESASDTAEIVTTPKMRDKPPARGPRERAGSRDRPGPRERSGPTTRIFVGVGREGGVGPGDLVGAITGEAGVTSRDIGAIDINDRFALVEVPEELADTIIDALRATTIKGHKPKVRRERSEEPVRRRDAGEPPRRSDFRRPPKHTPRGR